MASLKEDLNTFRLYGRGLSKYDFDDQVEDLFEDDFDLDEEDEEEDDEEEEMDESYTGLTSESLGYLDLFSLAMRIVKLLKKELVFERERYSS